MQMQPIEFSDFNVELSRKRIRRMNLHVTPERVWMSIPYHTSRDDAERFIKLHYDWIVRQRAKILRQHIENQDLYDGKPIWLWGTPLCLRFVPTAGMHQITQEGKNLYFNEPADTPEYMRKKWLDGWLYDQFAKALPGVSARWEAVSGCHALKYYIRDMKTRWGSCSLKTGRICINFRLVHERPECLDYVMIHELTHLLVPNHSPAFWAHMDQFYPNWRMVRKSMRK